MRPEPASRTLTFLFTDVEGSTRLWEQHRRHAGGARAPRRDPPRRASRARAARSSRRPATGSWPSSARPSTALAAGLSRTAGPGCASRGARPGRSASGWGSTPARPPRADGDYFGPTLNRAARIMAAGHGGQMLLSAAAAALVTDAAPGRRALRDLGEHRLKDLGRAERVFQLVHPGLPADFPPLSTLDAPPTACRTSRPRSSAAKPSCEIRRAPRDERSGCSR